MKRTLPLFLATALLASLLSACAGGGTTEGGTSGISTGLGVATSIKSSASATDEKAGNAQADSLIAAVTLDSNGKIVKCSIDAAQTKVAFDNAGAITSDLTAQNQTKGEKGEGYGMKKASAIGKEWNEQAAAFSEWAIGKTVDEVKNLKTKKVDDSHPQVPDVPELTSSVTVTVGDFITAIEKAAANAVSVNVSGSYKTGLGVYTKTGSSKAATAEAAGQGQVDSAIAAVTIDANGKVVACTIDAAQTRIGFDAEGQITADLNAAVKTKLELGEAYGMKKASAIGKEWNEQIDTFAKWTIGKTLSEIKGLKTKQVDDSHPQVPDVPELTSSVTISVGDYIAAVEKAINNAK